MQIKLLDRSIAACQEVKSKLFCDGNQKLKLSKVAICAIAALAPLSLLIATTLHLTGKVVLFAGAAAILPALALLVPLASVKLLLNSNAKKENKQLAENSIHLPKKIKSPSTKTIDHLLNQLAGQSLYILTIGNTKLEYIKPMQANLLKLSGAIDTFCTEYKDSENETLDAVEAIKKIIDETLKQLPNPLPEKNYRFLEEAIWDIGNEWKKVLW